MGKTFRRERHRFDDEYDYSKNRKQKKVVPKYQKERQEKIRQKDDFLNGTDDNTETDFHRV